MGGEAGEGWWGAHGRGGAGRVAGAGAAVWPATCITGTVWSLWVAPRVAVRGRVAEQLGDDPPHAPANGTGAGQAASAATPAATAGPAAPTTTGDAGDAAPSGRTGRRPRRRAYVANDDPDGGDVYAAFLAAHLGPRPDYDGPPPF